jgi:hypothetical protein
MLEEGKDGLGIRSIQGVIVPIPLLCLQSTSLYFQVGSVVSELSGVMQDFQP